MVIREVRIDNDVTNNYLRRRNVTQKQLGNSHLPENKQVIQGVINIDGGMNQKMISNTASNLAI